MTVELGNKIGGGKIDKTAGGKTEKERKVAKIGAEKKGKDDTKKTEKRGEKIPPKGPAGRNPLMNENTEITDLLGNFVKDNRQ